MKLIVKPEWLKSKIGRRFAFYVVLIGIIMAMVLSFIISCQQYRHKVTFLEKELNSIISTNRSFIEESLWIFDTRLLNHAVRGFLVNGDIVFAQITDENGNIVVSHGKLDIENDIIKTIPLYHKKDEKNIFLGHLTVAASKLLAIKEAKLSIILTLIQSLLLMSFISLSIIYIFWHLVSRHLVTIQQYTRHITFEEQKEPLVLDRPINKHTKNDELTSTVDAINFMYSKAIEAYRKLECETSEKIKLEHQLRHIQKMESIGRLAAGIAHDFNNVLSVIIGYSELLLKEIPTKDPIYEKINCILDSGSKAATLTRQLLAFSRKQVLEKKIISINAIIRNFLKILNKIVGENIVITTYLSNENCFVEADPGQIEQVIMNLIVNARDAMPDGGEIIIETAEVQLGQRYVEKHQEIKPGQYVLIAISDTGEGMDEEVLPKIFDPFFTTKEQGKGTGLGLATVYGIVKQHGGYIYAYSEKGRGTTFKIYLPLCKKTAEDKESKSEAMVCPQGNETVLIVDDNASICQLIVETLKPLGYNCLLATSGKDAINVLHKYRGKVHLLITDVVMPGMSGRELAEIIKRERPEIKVIFMSGYTENIIVHHGVLEQGINYISKPITPATLSQKIRSVLNDDST